MEGPDSTPREGETNVLLEVFPGAFLLGGATALAGGALGVASRSAELGAQARSMEQIALATGWVDQLAEALFATTLAMLLVTAGRRSGRKLLLALGALLAVAVLLTNLTGFPAADARVTAGHVACALGLAAAVVVVERLRFRGPIALVVGVALGVLPTWRIAETIKGDDAGIPVRVVLYDLVAAPDLFETLEARADAPPGPGVLTPAVDQQTDTGDKPALVLPPPAVQQMTVPRAAGAVRLMASVGADASVIQRLPANLDALKVRYAVTVDGATCWSEVVEHRRMPAGVWDTSVFQWRHITSADGPGIGVRGGQVLRFETALVWDSEEERAIVEGLDGAGLRLGFGGVTLEKEFREPRQLATPEAPNIVYVVMDTLRRDRLGLYGYERPTTPRLDAFARDGLVFEDAYTTSSWTWPSTASLFTGRLPDSHGVKSSKACTLSQRLPTLAEALQARGYTTAAFVGNPIVEPNRYFDQGFETFEVEVPKFRMSDEVMPAALEWLDVHAPVRFFLYLHLVDPHTPHRPHPEEAARLRLPAPPDGWPARGLDGVPSDPAPTAEIGVYSSQLYDASVATGDRWFGALLDELERLDLDQRTIVVFTSDHGEELFEHGRHGHGHEVYDELVRAPLVMRGPGIPAERRFGVVSNRHVPTTLAALAGATLRTPGIQIQLVDDQLPDEALFETSKGLWGTARYQQLFGLRRGSTTTHLRVRATPEEPLGLRTAAEGDLRLFDVVGDPGQERDLAGARPALAERGERRIRELVEEAIESRPPLVLGVGAQGQQQLEQIGYADGRDR